LSFEVVLYLSPLGKCALCDIHVVFLFKIDIHCIDSLAYAIKKFMIGEDKIEIAEEIKHFCHQHDLKLIDELLINNEKCDGCMHPVFPLFYTCSQCIFFIHKSCVEVPQKSDTHFTPPPHPPRKAATFLREDSIVLENVHTDRRKMKLMAV
jgi:hypothetical protein